MTRSGDRKWWVYLWGLEEYLWRKYTYSQTRTTHKTLLSWLSRFTLLKRNLINWSVENLFILECNTVNESSVIWLLYCCKMIYLDCIWTGFYMLYKHVMGNNEVLPHYFHKNPNTRTLAPFGPGNPITPGCPRAPWGPGGPGRPSSPGAPCQRHKVKITNQHFNS